MTAVTCSINNLRLDSPLNWTVSQGVFTLLPLYLFPLSHCIIQLEVRAKEHYFDLSEL